MPTTPTQPSSSAIKYQVAMRALVAALRCWPHALAQSSRKVVHLHGERRHFVTQVTRGSSKSLTRSAGTERL